MRTRKIDRVTSSPLQPGFLGSGHLAAAVIGGQDFSKTDPFIVLMDDRLDLPGGEPVGGAHPHAGFETVTLVLQGDGKDWQTGSLEIMTAGKGIVHTEEITARTSMRILQLWLVLPPEKRWAEPHWQRLTTENVPTLNTEEFDLKVYSGHSHGLASPMQNQTPFTLTDTRLKPGAAITEELPASYNGFIYILEGSVQVGNSVLHEGQTGWFHPLIGQGETELTISTVGDTSRFVLYAGEPQKAQIISYGPFIADRPEEIQQLYQDYRKGRMPHLNDLPAERRIDHVRS